MSITMVRWVDRRVVLAKVPPTSLPQQGQSHAWKQCRGRLLVGDKEQTDAIILAQFRCRQWGTEH